MNYSQALAWLYDTQLYGIKLGLENAKRLLDALAFRGEKQRFIHVAGTNGKGSVCAMLAAICRAQGICTGLFTSPHLVTYRERILIDGEMISQDDVARGLTKIREIVADWETHPTFFEITTALALDYFERENADVVVLETGMGGRLDATNNVTPVVCAITAIDLDHQAWLGSTLAQIAAEKAGIIKPGVPVVSAPQRDVVLQVLHDVSAKKNAPIQFAAEPLAGCEVALAGTHQLFNAALTQAALRAAGIHVSDEAIRHGFHDVEWPGRFQIIGNDIVLDGAHNEAAAKRLVLTWREIFASEKATIILGILKDKDVPAILGALAPLAARFVIVPVRSPRSCNVEMIRELLESLHPKIVCESAADFASALVLAQKNSEHILVTGSFFLVGEALAFLRHGDTRPEISAQ